MDKREMDLHEEGTEAEYVGDCVLLQSSSAWGTKSNGSE